ncbi:hypothetical protein FQZ97_765360 [compost metagenome]
MADFPAGQQGEAKNHDAADDQESKNGRCLLLHCLVMEQQCLVRHFQYPSCQFLHRFRGFFIRDSAASVGLERSAIVRQGIFGRLKNVFVLLADTGVQTRYLSFGSLHQLFPFSLGLLCADLGICILAVSHSQQFSQ